MPVPGKSRVVGMPVTSVAHSSHVTTEPGTLLAGNEMFDKLKPYDGCAPMTTAAYVNVLTKENLGVTAKLEFCKSPPGADVVSIIANVLFSSRGRGDDDGDGVNDGVAVQLFVTVGVPEPEGETDRDFVPVLEDVNVGEPVLLGDDPADGVRELDGV